MKVKMLSTLRTVDESNAHWYLDAFGERDSLIILLFHSLFQDEAEVLKSDAAPQQAITVAKFRQIIEYFLRRDYRFIRPADVLDNLSAGRKYLMLTFDDGYFNNSRALPVLEEYGVPAVFFISIGHVLEQKAFWWDALHRAGRDTGVGARRIARMKTDLKSRCAGEIERKIINEFGGAMLRPVSDTDRPFTVAELGDFARNQWTVIGNHTVNHAILTNHSAAVIRAEIRACQEELACIVGAAPTAISYPNGNFSTQVVEIAKEEGLYVGITGRTRKNYLPLVPDGNAEMTLGRMVPYGRRAITAQCEAFRAEVGVYRMAKRASERIRRL